MKRLPWLFLLAGLALAPLMLRAIHLAGTSPFDHGLPEGTPTRMQVGGLVAEIACGDASLQLEAKRATAGHEDVMHFRLGPSTFLDLRHVVARYSDAEGRSWIVRGPRARLTPHALEFRRSAVYRVADLGPRGAHELTIHLDTGRTSID